MTLQDFFLTFFVSFLDRGFTWPSFGGDSGKNNSFKGQSLHLRNVLPCFPNTEESQCVLIIQGIDWRLIRTNVPNRMTRTAFTFA